MRVATRVENSLSMAIPSQGLRTLPENDLRQLERLHDEIEEMQELMLYYLYDNSAPA